MNAKEENKTMTKEQLLNQNKIDKATIANYERKIAEYALALDSRNKVLKIIKEKPATFSFIMDCDVHTYEDYLDILASNYLSLLQKYKYTETEFELLKEYFK